MWPWISKKNSYPHVLRFPLMVKHSIWIHRMTKTSNSQPHVDFITKFQNSDGTSILDFFFPTCWNTIWCQSIAFEFIGWIKLQFLNLMLTSKFNLQTLMEPKIVIWFFSSPSEIPFSVEALPPSARYIEDQFHYFMKTSKLNS